MIPRLINLARAEWTPADPARCEGRTDANSHGRADAEECHQSGRVDWWACDRSARDPAPAATRLDPAAIMEWREAPRVAVNPCPAPGSDIGPLAFLIRHPVRSNLWIPDLAIVGRIRPGAVGRQILPPRYRCHSGRRWGGRRAFGIQHGR